MDAPGPTLLVADDEPLNQDIIVEFLDGSPYVLRTASDGAQAWAMLEADPDLYDAVLLDRMMPNMDGIEVIRRMKAHAQLRTIPVIMQTAAAARDDIASGLQAGAYYYLTKPFDERVLRSVLDSAVDDHRRYRHLLEKVTTRDNALGLLQHARLSVRSVADAHDAATMLAGACPHPERVVTGLSELLLNAVEHGNLGVSYADKTRLNETGNWQQEIERRLELAQNAHKRVAVEFERGEASIVIRIVDAGEGFDWRKYLEMDPARAFDSHGRGIAMARLLSFDGLRFIGCGNQVEVEIECRRGRSATPGAAAAGC